MTRWQATTSDPGDPGHLIPGDVWAAIVADVEAPRLPSVGRGAVDRTVTARSHGGKMAGGPRLGVLHSAETPLQRGYAYSIAANWFATKASTSAHLMIDPGDTIRMLPDNVVSYAVGPRANGFTFNVEQAGYARFSEAQWTSADGLAQMARVATEMREVSARWGIPLRWATAAQIRAAAAGGAPQGWCTHNDVARVLGGTTHTDPMPHYPLDRLMALAVGRAAPTPAEDDEMDPKIATLIGNTAWRLEQMAVVQAAMVDLLNDEDAQTDRLEWGLLDEQQGVRAQIAALGGQVTGFAAALTQVTAGGSVDLAAVAEAASAGTRAVMAELAAAVGSVATPRTAVRRDLHDRLRVSVERLAAGPTDDELQALTGVVPTVI